MRGLTIQTGGGSGLAGRLAEVESQLTEISNQITDLTQRVWILIVFFKFVA